MSRATRRAAESSTETEHRREQDRTSRATRRVAESQSETEDRRKHDQAQTAKKRASNTSTEKAISVFLSRVKCGPEFACTSIIIVTELPTSTKCRRQSPNISLSLPAGRHW